MSKLVRRKKEIGAALIVALQLTTLGLIGLMLPVAGGPQQPAKAPADSQITADQTQNQNVQVPTGTDRSALRASAVYANKVYGPRASQIFNLATSRAESAESTRQTAQQSMQEGELPNEATLTTDQEDYPPYSYVYMTGTGFQPGEMVDMIVVELDPIQGSFEPWQVEADENGEIHTSWYIFSTDFIGATLQATATGDSSQFTASATFTDASGAGTMTVSPTSVSPGSTNNSFTFQFRAPNGAGNAYGAGSFATVVIPAGWTTPTTTSGQPGFVNATGVGTGTVTGAITVTGSGPWTITVPFTASGTSNGFNLTYGVGAGAPVTAPCATGAYTFTTSTSQNGNPVAQVNPSPRVFDGISATLAAGAFGAGAGNLNSLQSTTVTANAGQTLLILVTAEDDSNGNARTATVANTSGANPLSGGSATLITTNAGSSNSWVCSGNDCFFMYAFRATATGIAGTVTVNFPTAVKNAAVDVIALSGNNPSTPIGLTGIASGNNSSPNWNLSGSLTPGSSMLLFGDTTNFTATPPTWSTTPPAVFTLVDSFTETDGARTHNLVNYFGGPSALSVSSSLSASARWGTLAIEILPATAPPCGTPTPTPTPSPTPTPTPSPTPTPTCNPPSVDTNPVSQTVTYGVASVSFTATASGTPAPTVQWQVSTGGPFTDIGGATNTTLSIVNPTVAMNGNQYRAVFTSSCAPGTATSSAATLTVDPAPLTITASDVSKTYGDTHTFDTTTPSTDFSVSGTLYFSDSVNSVTLSSAGAAATATFVAPGPAYAITVNTAVGTGLSNYAIIYTPGTLTITQASLTVAAHNVSKTYGDAYTFDTTTPSTDFGVAGLKNSDTVASVTLSSAGAAATATFVAPGPTYAITVSGASGTGLGNYIISYTPATLTISQASLTVAANNVGKVYGDIHTFDETTPSTDFSVTGLKNSDTVDSVSLSSAGAAAAATFVAPGPTYAIAVGSASGTGLGNYIVSYTPATLTITQASLTVAANNASKVYGAIYTFDTTTPSIDFSAMGLKNSDTVDSVTLSSAGAAGTATFVAPGPTYAITVGSASGTGLGNYIISYTAGTLTITQASLAVTVNDATKTYGDIYAFDTTPPSIDFTVTGTLYNGDAVDSVTLSSDGAAATATFVAPGPTYAITVSDASGPGLGNYIISYTPGTLTITQASLAVTANNVSKTYGDEYAFDTTTPSTDFSVAGLKNSDTVATVTLSSAGAAATATFVAPGPTYAITVSDAAGTGLGNYIIGYTPATLTVNQAALTVAVTNVSKTYGDEYTFDDTTPSTDFSVTGLKNSDSVDSVSLSSAGTAATATFVAPGPSYAITIGGASGTGLGNYIISYTPGTLTITQAPLTVHANNASKTYGAIYTFDTTTPSSDFSVTGLKNSDAVDTVELSSAGAAGTATFVAPGPTYAITVSDAIGTGLGNYIISYTPGTLTINQAPLTITAADKTKTYGQTVTFVETTPSSDFTVTGTLYNGDTVASITLTSTGAAATATYTSPGPNYPTVPSAAVGGGLGNYNIGYVNGNLHINQALLTITATNQSKTYGATFTPDATTQFMPSGLVNSDSVTSVTLASDGYAATATYVSPGPNYDIVASAAVGSGLGNYIISYANGTLHVNQASLTITATSRTKTYGVTYTADTTPPSVDFNVSGLVNSDSVTSITLSSSGYAASATFTAPGPDYTVTPSAAVGTGLGNYMIGYVEGNLHVNQATLTITATNRSKVFGATYTADTTPPSPDLNISGLVNSDTVTNVTLTCAGYAAAALPSATPYPVVPSAAVGMGLGNYTIGYVNGQFTIGYGACSGPNPNHQILPPINVDGSSVWKVGSTVPVKFTVCDANGNPISEANAVFATGYGSITLINTVRGTVNNVNEATYTDIPDVAFRWASDKWIFNMATSNLQKNTTYTFRINLKDGSYIEFSAGTK